MLRKFKDSREAAHADKARAEAERRLEGLSWEANRAYEAWGVSQLEDRLTKVPGVQLKKDEVAHLLLNGVGLVEPRRGPSTWVGGSQGMSFRVAKGVRYRVGHVKGHTVQGEEKPTVIDTGTGVVTNQRMIFVGSKRSTEWAYSKLLGLSLEEDGMAIFNVSNRQKASGFGYPEHVDHIVDAVVSASVAAFSGPDEHAAVVEELLQEYTRAHGEWDALNRELNGSPAAELPDADSQSDLFASPPPLPG